MRKFYQGYNEVLYACKKALLIALMISITAFTLFGCSSESKVEKDVLPAQSETEVIVETESVEHSTEAATEEAMPWDDSLVTDIFFDDSHTDAQGNPCYYHIPKINLDTPGAKVINERVYGTLYEQIFSTLVLKSPTPQIDAISYTWTVKDHFLSMITAIHIIEGDMTLYTSVFYDLDSGTEPSFEDILALYDFTIDDFVAVAPLIINGGLTQINEGLDGDLVEKNFSDQLSVTLSSDNLATVQPFIDAQSGDFCFAATLFDIYCQNKGQYLFNLTSPMDPTNPITYRDITQSWE